MKSVVRNMEDCQIWRKRSSDVRKNICSEGNYEITSNGELNTLINESKWGEDDAEPGRVQRAENKII